MCRKANMNERISSANIKRLNNNIQNSRIAARIYRRALTTPTSYKVSTFSLLALFLLLEVDRLRCVLFDELRQIFDFALLTIVLNRCRATSRRAIENSWESGNFVFGRIVVSSSVHFRDDDRINILELLRQFGIFRLELLAVATPRCVELDQNIPVRIVDNFLERVTRNNFDRCRIICRLRFRLDVRG